MSEAVSNHLCTEVGLLRERVDKLEKQTEDLKRQLADLKKTLDKNKFKTIDL